MDHIVQQRETDETAVDDDAVSELMRIRQDTGDIA